LDPGCAGRRAADRLDPLLRLARLPAVHGRADVSLHGDRAGVASLGPVRQGSGMSELQAGQGALNVARAAAKSTRYRDVLIAFAAFIILALLPALTSSKFMLDFVIRCAAYGLFATSLNLLVGYTGLTS